jgi:hypothetical protein
VLAASLAHRLLGIGAELVAALGSNLAARRQALPETPAPGRLPQGPVGRP